MMKVTIKQRLAVSAAFFLSGLCFSSWASRLPFLKNLYALSEAELGVLLLILPIGSMIGLPVAGYFVDWFGSKTTILFSVIFCGLILTALSVSPSIIILGFLLVFLGISGNTLIFPLTHRHLSYKKTMVR